MHEKDIARLSDLLEAYIYHMDSDRNENRALMKALEIINENSKNQIKWTN